MRKSLSIKRGRYDLLLPLGEGKLTRVYLAIARDPLAAHAPPGLLPPREPVVVKRLRPELAREAHLRDLFLEAAHVARHLEDPRVARTFEVWSEGDEHLFAMEYLEGQTLSDIVRRIGAAKMPLEEHLLILSEALAGLAYVHTARGPGGRSFGGSHREVSAGNLLVTYDGAVKLMDFALSQAVEPVRTPPPARITIGPGAPEQFCGLGADARSDVFAMGVLLWEALARRARAEGANRAALVNARVTGQEPRLAEIAPEVPAPLAAVAERAIALDPEARFASAAEFRVALDQARAALPRKVGTRDLGALVARNFQLDRAALRRRIDQHLADAVSEPAPPPRVTPPRMQITSDKWPPTPVIGAGATAPPPQALATAAASPPPVVIGAAPTAALVTGSDELPVRWTTSLRLTTIGSAVRRNLVAVGVVGGAAAFLLLVIAFGRSTETPAPVRVPKSIAVDRPAGAGRAPGPDFEPIGQAAAPRDPRPTPTAVSPPVVSPPAPSPEAEPAVAPEEAEPAEETRTAGRAKRNGRNGETFARRQDSESSDRQDRSDRSDRPDRQDSGDRALREDSGGREDRASVRAPSPAPRAFAESAVTPPPVPSSRSTAPLKNSNGRRQLDEQDPYR